jgi:hypothetical protein
MITRDELFKTRNELHLRFEENQAKLNEGLRETDEFVASQKLCGCKPLCSYHSNWKEENLQKLVQVRARMVEFIEDEKEFQAVLKQAECEAELREMTNPSPEYDSPSRNSEMSSSHVCPECAGKGYIEDHNLLGINDVGEETCYMCKGSGKSVVNHWGKCSTCNGTGRVQKRRGAFDLLFHGGGNHKECHRCHGMGYID